MATPNISSSSINAKSQQIGPVFPDYLSVSDDYLARNLDEYMLSFLKYCWPKVQNEGNIKKNQITASHNCFFFHVF